MNPSPPLLGWSMAILGGVTVGALLFLAFFFGVRIGESGARVMLDSLRASVQNGIIVHLDSGPALWVTPRDTIRKAYVPRVAR
jgi:hypothetical protein